VRVLEAKNITKRFPGVVALADVDISIDSGEIHCIIGENGAGKSTLIKCLTGVYEPEAGEIFINGKDASKDRSLFRRVAYVPQEISLFSHMTVAENLFLPYEKTGVNGIINQKKLNQMALPLLKNFKINVEPDMLIRDIPVSAQQLIQIVRATMYQDYEILMLDEPTTSLTTEDTEILFDIIRGIRATNKAIVFISHKLEEIFALGDVITVFRNGRKVAHDSLSSVDLPWVITRMTGRSIDQDEKFFSDKVTSDVLLEVNHLTGARFRDISFQLKKGEILGFCGLVGAGRSELMQAIFGYIPAYAGSVTLNGKPLKLHDAHYSVQNGLIYLPEERKKQGILPMLSVRANICVSSLSKLQKGLAISGRLEEKMANDVIATYDIKTPDTDKEIRFLSGGNQQKVIIGRSMSCEPKVLVFDEPTKGIDVGTRTEIYRLMKKLAEDKQIGIILISSDMEEVMKCANRIIALYHGSIYGEFAQGEHKENIMSAIIGVQVDCKGSYAHD
jgi:ABC-type sugar transport system ATPase subunit